MKKRLVLGIAVIVAAMIALTALGISGNAPPPPPPDRIGVSMVCLNTETRMPEDFKGKWDGTQVPWLLTSAEVHFKMVPDGTGWKTIVDEKNIWIMVVDIQGHYIKSYNLKDD